MCFTVLPCADPFNVGISAGMFLLVSAAADDQLVRMSPPLRLSGACGTASSVDPCTLLRALGQGTPLDPSIRVEMERDFAADFSKVIVHSDDLAERIGEQLGAEAFTIGCHIAFRRGRFQPNSNAGEQLLRHELAHTLESGGREEHVRCWNSTRVNPGTKNYLLNGVPRYCLVVSGGPGTTHEALARQAIAQVGDFGERAKQVLDFWVAESDRWKDRFSQLVAQGFPDLQRIVGTTLPENLLHAYGGRLGGCGFDEIGMSSRDVSATLTGRGFIGRLLAEAIRNYENGSSAATTAANQQTTDHALRLLGISLHAVQDFFSHKVPILDDHRVDLRESLTGPDNGPMTILEDDPTVDSRRRWNQALLRTKDQIYNFRQALSPASRQLLRTLPRTN